MLYPSFATTIVAALLSFNVVWASEGAASSISACELTQCTTVCPSNLTEFENSMYSSACNGKAVTTIKLLTSDQGIWAAEAAKRFSAERPDVNVEIVELAGNSNLFKNIINEAKSKTGLFDIFITPPHVMGDIVEEDGWADLTDFIQSNKFRGQDWSDIFLGYRKWISQFQDKILMFPLDGDVLSMFYREDILEEFGLEVPRTWDEYNFVANATHGKVFQNKTLTGSCIGRMPGCAGAYWANLVLSSMTQTKGMSTGSLFDTSDMTPLLGEAFEKTLEWMETQSKYGPDNELDKCIGVNTYDMNEGECVLTYSWGNSFMAHLQDSVFKSGDAKLGVAMTPGTTHVLDRDTMKLVPCDEELCSTGGIYYDDIGWVNRAPYLAFGGWACAVNNYTTDEKKTLAAEFCAYASSQEQSNKFFQKDASEAVVGPDPFRQSQLDINMWVENGYDSNSVLEYFQSINGALGSENAVMDIRFPISNEFYGLLDKKVHSYVNGTVFNTIPESERATAREEITNQLDEEFKTLIDDYNAKASTRSSLLKQYQKLRNVYYEDVNMNYLGDTLRTYGFTIGSLQLTLCVVFAIWTYFYRKAPVIKASQPFFLILLCVGIFTFASSIFPMVVDDEYFSVEACSRACMSLPWLICLGWSILFSALFAKLRRINLVVSNARHFRSVKISEKDMMSSISILFTINLLLITLLNVLDPLIWKRVQVSPTESFGFCTVADRSSVTWKVIVVLLGILNGGVLISANVEAFKARKIDSEYGESMYIGLIMLFFLQITLVGVPLLFIVQNNYVARFFLITSIISIMAMSVLLLIFVPKFIVYRRRLAEKASGKSKKRFNTIRVSGHIPSSNRDIFEEAQKTIEARQLYEKTWKERIDALEAVLKESGVDAKSCLKDAKIIGNDDEIIPIGDDTSSLGRGSAIAGSFIGTTMIAGALSRGRSKKKLAEPIPKIPISSIAEEEAPPAVSAMTDSVTDRSHSAHLFAPPNLKL